MLFFYIIGFILFLYICNNITFKDKFWLVLFALDFFVPVINTLLPIAFIIILGYFDLETDAAVLKDTKLNRWLFKSKFNI